MCFWLDWTAPTFGHETSRCVRLTWPVTVQESDSLIKETRAAICYQLCWIIPVRLWPALQKLSSKALWELTCPAERQKRQCGATAFSRCDPKSRRHTRPSSRLTSSSKASRSKELSGRLWGDSNITYLTPLCESKIRFSWKYAFSGRNKSAIFAIFLNYTVFGCFRSTGSFFLDHEDVCI